DFHVTGVQTCALPISPTIWPLVQLIIPPACMLSQCHHVPLCAYPDQSARGGARTGCANVGATYRERQICLSGVRQKTCQKTRTRSEERRVGKERRSSR